MTDVAWIHFGAGYGTTDSTRNEQLMASPSSGNYDIVLDHELRDRFQRSGVDEVFFVWSIVDSDEQPRRSLRRRNPASWGGDSASGLYVEADFPDDPSRPIGPDLERWLSCHIREVLLSWKQLKV